MKVRIERRGYAGGNKSVPNVKTQLELSKGGAETESEFIDRVILELKIIQDEGEM